MKWIFVISLLLVLAIVISLSAVGANIISLPMTHDPFPAAVRTQLNALNAERREIERLAGKARTFGKESELTLEKQTYDELAADANAWLKTAQDGLDLNSVDTPYLTEQFEKRLRPNAEELIAKLKLKQPLKLAQNVDWNKCIS